MLENKVEQMCYQFKNRKNMIMVTQKLLHMFSLS